MTGIDFPYRTYFAIKDLGIQRVLHRWPRLMRGIKRSVHFILPKKPVWLRVRSGISAGMWMRLRLPQEVRYWRGEHERAIQDAIAAMVLPGAVVYDIGAHIGSFALGATRLTGQAGRVVAFEADPENVASLVENASRNNLTATLQVVPCAVWSRTTTRVAFRRGGVQRTHGGVETDGQRTVLGSGDMIQVPAIALDDFIKGGGPIPQLVKIDVEGGEYEVLRGGEKLFAAGRPLIIAEVHHLQTAEQIAAWLTEYHYRAQWTIPSEGFPRHMFAWPQHRDATSWAGLGRGRSCSTGN